MANPKIAKGFSVSSAEIKSCFLYTQKESGHENAKYLYQLEKLTQKHFP